MIWNDTRLFFCWNTTSRKIAFLFFVKWQVGLAYIQNQLRKQCKCVHTFQICKQCVDYHRQQIYLLGLRPKTRNQLRPQGAKTISKDKSKMRLCVPRRLEQDAPVYVHELFLLIWPQLKIANWLQGSRTKNLNLQRDRKLIFQSGKQGKKIKTREINPRSFF